MDTWDIFIRACGWIPGISLSERVGGYLGYLYQSVWVDTWGIFIRACGWIPGISLSEREG